MGKHGKGAMAIRPHNMGALILVSGQWGPTCRSGTAVSISPAGH